MRKIVLSIIVCSFILSVFVYKIRGSYVYCPWLIDRMDGYVLTLLNEQTFEQLDIQVIDKDMAIEEGLFVEIKKRENNMYIIENICRRQSELEKERGNKLLEKLKRYERISQFYNNMKE